MNMLRIPTYFIPGSKKFMHLLGARKWWNYWRISPLVDSWLQVRSSILEQDGSQHALTWGPKLAPSKCWPIKKGQQLVLWTTSWDPTGVKISVNPVRFPAYIPCLLFVWHTLLFAKRSPIPSIQTCRSPPWPLFISCTGNSPPNSGPTATNEKQFI